MDKVYNQIIVFNEEKTQKMEARRMQCGVYDRAMNHKTGR